MTATDIDVLSTALTWLALGQKVLLATVVSTWGSAPRKAGAHMVIREDGLFEGSVSGGCVEGEVIKEALGLLERGTSVGCQIEFGVSTETAWSVGLSCGGRIVIWLVPVVPSILDNVMSRIARREGVGLYFSQSGQQVQMVEAVYDGLQSVAQSPKSIVQPDGAVIRLYTPPKRLFIIGAVHIAQVLTSMAQQVGYVVHVVDPRGIFLSPERWGHMQTSADFPEEYLTTVCLDKYDALVALSHNPTFDDEALYLALQRDTFYVGALGSRRNHAKRCARLQERGCTELQTERIHGPVGLNIGAQTPSEIAVSILAELIQQQRQAR